MLNTYIIYKFQIDTSVTWHQLHNLQMALNEEQIT